MHVKLRNMSGEEHVLHCAAIVSIDGKPFTGEVMNDEMTQQIIGTLQLFDGRLIAIENILGIKIQQQMGGS